MFWKEVREEEIDPAFLYQSLDAVCCTCKSTPSVAKIARKSLDRWFESTLLSVEFHNSLSY